MSQVNRFAALEMIGDDQAIVWAVGSNERAARQKAAKLSTEYHQERVTQGSFVAVAVDAQWDGRCANDTTELVFGEELANLLAKQDALPA